MQFEFLIPKRPVSLQARNRANLQKWKDFVFSEASKMWTGGKPYSGELHITIVYLCGKDPVDADNVIKPIQDALEGLVYDKDDQITDVESHRRPLTGTFDITNFPPLLIQGITSGNECVYVKICDAKSLENYIL
jgi:crossover junction endodeoxyribonuclease RusA